VFVLCVLCHLHLHLHLHLHFVFSLISTTVVFCFMCCYLLL